MIDASSFRSSLQTLEAGIVNAQAMAVRAAVDAAKRDAKGTTLFRDVTGTLRNNIDGTAFGPKGQLVAKTNYAFWVENGTKPHVITARGGGMLSFVQNGQRRFARSVRHPGTTERPFMRHAGQIGEQALDYGLDYFVGAAIDHFNG